MQYFIPTLLAAVLLAACSPAPEARAQPDAPRTISVSGNGEASAAPDIAYLSVGVESEGATAGEALSRNSAEMSATIEKLKARGVAGKDMQTQNLSVSPRYNYEENRSQPKIIGYVATNMLAVKLRDLGAAGSIIDDAVASGANNLSSLSFGFADPKPLEKQAREDAVKDAKEKAALLAEAAGVALGPVLRIEDGFAAPPPAPYVAGRAMAMEAKAAPIEAGEQTFTATVTIIYSIR
ncbi:MAG: SIMPL domain-containing protein [Amphiplicatus sp.]